MMYFLLFLEMSAALKMGSERIPAESERLLYLRDDGSVPVEHEHDVGTCCCSFLPLPNLCIRIATTWLGGLRAWMIDTVEVGKSDPKTVVFAAKMGLALMFIALLILLKEPFEDMHKYPVWALLTVVFMFEFNIGATVRKGFNQALGTIFAGGLALGMGVLSTLTGVWLIIYVASSIFIIGFCTTYLIQKPSMKPYRYGFRVFLFVYCFFMLSGYTTTEFISVAATIFLIIAVSASVCLVINLCIYPMWAGNELQALVVNGLLDVAASLEDTINAYLNCAQYKRSPSVISTYQPDGKPLYSGYKSAALESASEEDELVRFAMSEPPHCPYMMLQYPWKSYTKVSRALRHCTLVLLSLRVCTSSEIQAAADKRELLYAELQRVGKESSNVLRELGSKMNRMEKLGPVEILHEVREAAEDLRKKMDQALYLLLNLETTAQQSSSYYDFAASTSSRAPDLGDSTSAAASIIIKPDTPLAAAFMPQDFHPDQHTGQDQYENVNSMSLITFGSLLIEFVASLQNLVDSFQILSKDANFSDPDVEETIIIQDTGIWTRMQILWRFLWY